MIHKPLSIFLLLIPLLIGTEKGGSDSGPSLEGCLLTITSDHSTYEPGQPIKLHILLLNTRPQLSFPEDGAYAFDIDVFLADDTPAPLTLWGRDHARQTKFSGVFRNNWTTLTAGQGYNCDYPDLARRNDMTLDGRYKIVVHRLLPSETDPNAQIDLTSNELTVTVATPNAQPTTRAERAN
jgi:hypothetical protein